MNWNAAKQYCDDLTEDSYDGWRLPNIDELRTLIDEKHSGTTSGGSCRISENTGSLSQGFWTNSDCKGRTGGNFSKSGDSGRLWSSSARPHSGNRWYVDFSSGEINHAGAENQYHVRCIK